jgi:alkaline phosphatase D
MRSRSRLLQLLLLLPALLAATPLPDDGQPLSRIAVGSCIRQDKPQPIWPSVMAVSPELMILLGDNIYGDTQDMAVLKAKYEKLGADPGFARLRAECPIVATWDDHDYGVNDGGRDYPKRNESQQVFLDFFGEPADSPRRTRKGVYDAKIFGPAGKRVQVILLDTRYDRSPLTKKPGPPQKDVGPYLPDPSPDARELSDAQWAWLEAQLREPAELRLLCSSVQVVNDQQEWETWGNFPKERERLVSLINDTKATGVLILSGDRHLAELSKESVLPTAYPLYDLTASSLNQPHPRAATYRDGNRHRVGDVYLDVNFGYIDIDWNDADPVIRLQIRDIAGKPAIAKTLRLSELKPGATPDVEKK